MRLHPSGNYVVEGRKKDLINRGGEKISAEEIENLILQHPAVQNVACVPMPDPNLGEKMCACVDPAAGRAPVARGAGRVPEGARRSPSSSCRSGWRYCATSRCRPSARSRRRRCRRMRRAEETMRIIDLHCYPGTQEWIACQGPYVEALGEVLEPRLGRQDARTRSSKDFTDAGVEAVPRRARPRDDDRHAAVHQRVRARHVEAAPASGSSRPGAPSSPRRARSRSSQVRKAVRELGLHRLPLPPDHAALRGERPALLPAVRGDRRARRRGDDRRRHDRHGRRHARRHGRA